MDEVNETDPEQEWHRLVSDPYHSLELLVTMHYLRKHLPPTGKVLDAGGGPGRYSIELCRADYEVVLLDISSENITMVKDKLQLETEAIQNRLAEFVVGDIRDLSRFEPRQFDGVLCLGGPLTYISGEADRVTAMSELVRIGKPGGVVCISVMGYLAMLRTVLMQASHQLVDPFHRELLKQGNNRVGGMVWHFFRANELRKLAESCGLVTLEMAGCEGLSTNLREATNLIGEDATKWPRWVDLVLETSAEPAVVDMAEHILYVGRVSECSK